MSPRALAFSLAVAAATACSARDVPDLPDARFAVDGGSDGASSPCGPSCEGPGLACDDLAHCCPVAELCGGRCCGAGSTCVSDVCQSMALCTCDAPSNPLCACALGARVVSAPTAGLPALTWSGGEFGILWSDTRDGIASAQLYFASFGPDGAPRVTEQRLTDATGTRHSHQLAWNGVEHAMVWEDYRAGRGEIYFGRFDVAGARLDTDAPLTNEAGTSAYPAIVWSGSVYGVAWWDDRDSAAGSQNFEVYFTALDPDGSPRGPATRITNAAPCAACGGGSRPDTPPSLVATGPTTFGIAWSDDRDEPGREIYFVRATEPASVGTEVRITTEDGGDRRPSLVWNGIGFGLAWERDRPSDTENVYFTRLDADGAPIGAPAAVPCSGISRHLPVVTWTGSSYGIAWHQCSETPCAYSTYMTELDAAGAKISGDVLLDAGLGGASTFPAIAWSGAVFGLAWLHDATPTMNPPLDVEVYFSVAECEAIETLF